MKNLKDIKNTILNTQLIIDFVGNITNLSIHNTLICKKKINILNRQLFLLFMILKQQYCLKDIQQYLNIQHNYLVYTNKIFCNNFNYGRKVNNIYTPLLDREIYYKKVKLLNASIAYKSFCTNKLNHISLLNSFQKFLAKAHTQKNKELFILEKYDNLSSLLNLIQDIFYQLVANTIDLHKNYFRAAFTKIVEENCIKKCKSDNLLLHKIRKYKIDNELSLIYLNLDLK